MLGRARTDIELLHGQSVGPLVEAAHLDVGCVSALDEPSTEQTVVEFFSRPSAGSAVGEVVHPLAYIGGARQPPRGIPALRTAGAPEGEVEVALDSPARFLRQRNQRFGAIRMGIYALVLGASSAGQALSTTLSPSM